MGLVLTNAERFLDATKCSPFRCESSFSDLEKNRSVDLLQELQRVAKEHRQSTECDFQMVRDPAASPAQSADSDCSSPELSTLALLKVILISATNLS